MSNLTARLSIRRKLFVVNFVIILISTITAALVLIFLERTAMRERVANELSAQAEVLAFNSAASLAFNDASSATTILSALRAVPQIQEAIIFDLKHDVFARYLRNKDNVYHGGYSEIADGRVQWPNKHQHDVVFSDEGIFSYTPIVLDGERVGALFIHSSLENFNAYSQEVSFLGLIALAAALVVALVILSPIVKMLSDPLVELLRTVNTVRREKNYFVRAVKLADDEFGELADAFNAMLEEIAQRDSELSRHQLNLESQVQERTQAMKKANRHLEETIQALQHANRTIRISEQNKRVAEMSAAAKAQFLANMSHELRTPMNGVLGMLSLLLETRLKPDQRHYVDVAYESGKVLLELINNVLDFSKIEQGKMVLESITFDIRASIDEVVGIVGESAYIKGLELVVLWNPDIPCKLLGDPTRFRQLMLNIVGNAVKFTHEGYVSIEGFLIEGDNDRTRLRFEVKDTGVGIPENICEKIFEIFTQADSSTTRKYGGSGLGLALCKQIVECMGGAIGVESREGEGTNFWCEIPFLNSNDAFHDDVGGSVPCDFNVIVMDPNPVSANAMVHYLDEFNVRSHFVADEQALFELFEKRGEYFGKLLVSLDIGLNKAKKIADHLMLFEKVSVSNLIFYGSIVQRNSFIHHHEEVLFGFLTKPVRLGHLKKMFITTSAVDVASDG